MRYVISVWNNVLYLWHTIFRKKKHRDFISSPPSSVRLGLRYFSVEMAEHLWWQKAGGYCSLPSLHPVVNDNYQDIPRKGVAKSIGNESVKSSVLVQNSIVRYDSIWLHFGRLSNYIRQTQFTVLRTSPGKVWAVNRLGRPANKWNQKTRSGECEAATHPIRFHGEWWDSIPSSRIKQATSPESLLWKWICSDSIGFPEVWL